MILRAITSCPGKKMGRTPVSKFKRREVSRPLLRRSDNRVDHSPQRRRATHNGGMHGERVTLLPCPGGIHRNHIRSPCASRLDRERSIKPAWLLLVVHDGPNVIRVHPCPPKREAQEVQPLGLRRLPRERRIQECRGRASAATRRGSRGWCARRSSGCPRYTVVVPPSRRSRCHESRLLAERRGSQQARHFFGSTRSTDGITERLHELFASRRLVVPCCARRRCNHPMRRIGLDHGRSHAFTRTPSAPLPSTALAVVRQRRLAAAYAMVTRTSGRRPEST